MKFKKELINTLLASDIGTYELDFEENEQGELIGLIIMDNFGGEAKLSKNSFDKDINFVELVDYYDNMDNILELEEDILYNSELKENYRKLLEADPINSCQSQYRAEMLLKVRELDGEYNNLINNLK